LKFIGISISEPDILKIKYNPFLYGIQIYWVFYIFIWQL
jgi:hypothetical protein